MSKKFYAVQQVIGGVAADPAIFTSRKKAIRQYLEWLEGWSQVECKNGHSQPYPTEENFDALFEAGTAFCQECNGIWEPYNLGHDDDDLDFYDGLEAE